MLFECQPHVSEDLGYVFVQPCDDFDLKKTVTCGQAFNYFWLSGDLFSLQYKNHQTLCYQSSDGSLCFDTSRSAVEEIWIPYFDLTLDYNKSINSLPLNMKEKSWAKLGAGIHILNQDPLEMIVSYLISQRNTIQNIITIVKRLCWGYGELLATVHDSPYDVKVHKFPEIPQLCQLTTTDWRSLGVGYRAEYLHSMVVYIKKHPNLLSNLRELSHDSLVQFFTSFNGIGPQSCQLYKSVWLSSFRSIPS